MSDLPEPNETPPASVPEVNPPGQENIPQRLSSRQKKQLAAGFIGWFVLNGLMWWAATSPLGYRFGAAVNLIIFPVNIIVMIILAAKRSTRQIGLGILAAMGVNLLISLFLGIALQGLCLLPFYLDY